MLYMHYKQSRTEANNTLWYTMSYYFMLFGSLSDNNGGLSLDNGHRKYITKANARASVDQNTDLVGSYNIVIPWPLEVLHCKIKWGIIKCNVRP